MYSRIVSVSAGPVGQSGTTMQGVRCAFTVTRDETSEPDEIELELYNLAGSARTLFETVENRITLNAGHMDTGAQLLAIGDIASAHSELIPPEIRTTVVARDGGKAIRDKRAALSYRSGVSVKSMVDEVANMLEVDGVESSFDLSGAFKSGFAFVGQAREALDKLGARFGFNWAIQNNVLQLTERRMPTTRQPIAISPMTGLIGSPSRMDRTRTSSTASKEQPGVRAKCVLNPAILPGGQVTIAAAEFPSASYRVTSLTHRGDTHGEDWYTELEGVAVA